MAGSTRTSNAGRRPSPMNRDTGTHRTWHRHAFVQQIADGTLTSDAARAQNIADGQAHIALGTDMLLFNR
eukprot:90762-Pelagomonas_calceolata.AAC.3